MIESPLRDRILAQNTCQTTQRNITNILIPQSRFGKIPADLAETIRSIVDEAQRDDLFCFTASCPDLEAFRVRLANR